MLNRSIDEKFMRAEHRSMWTIIDHAKELIPAIQNAKKWDESAINFAAL